MGDDIFIKIGIIIAGLIPTLIWFLFFLREDIHPEPKRLLLYTFVIGVLVSIPVLAFQIIFRDLVQNFASATLFLVVGLALIEEVFKFCAAYWATYQNPELDEPVDMMVYCIAAGLGFATVENVFVAVNTYTSLEPLFTFTTLISTISLRLMGATLLHTLTSALIGYEWARGKILRTVRNHIFFGLLGATIIHTIFNALISIYQETNFLLYPSIMLLLVMYFILRDFETLKRIKTSLTQ